MTQIVFGALTQVQYNSLQAGLVAPVFGEVTAFFKQKSALPGRLPEARYRLNICVRIIQLVAERLPDKMPLCDRCRKPFPTQAARR